MKFKGGGGAVGTFKYGTGTITAGQNSVEVTHGVGAEPTCVTVTPMDNLEAPYQVLDATITSTKFTVNLVGGIVLPSNASFLWGAFK